ncbi:MAG TPA: hypothetical protein VFZ60_02400, partial [Nitrososphaeraceae archaeon]
SLRYKNIVCSTNKVGKAKHDSSRILFHFRRAVAVFIQVISLLTVLRRAVAIYGKPENHRCTLFQAGEIILQ